MTNIFEKTCGVYYDIYNTIDEIMTAKDVIEVWASRTRIHSIMSSRGYFNDFLDE
jgi:hypothetical protein